MRQTTLSLLARIEARAWQDAEDWTLELAWRHAAARISGWASMKAELLPSKTRKKK
jgi:hypothetical protein